MHFSFFQRYFRARNVYWNVVRELSSYTDRELHDIGIDRADIGAIARKAAQRMKGDVGIIPGNDEGSVFWLDLEPA